MKWILRVLLPAFAVAANGCTQGCDANLLHGLSLVILDETTGSPIESEVTVVVSEGAYTETVTIPPGGAPFAGLAPERPGTYRVEVHASGYLTWVRQSIRVTKDDCHVVPVEVIVRLVKSGTT
jgi:hypothetical protein